MRTHASQPSHSSQTTTFPTFLGQPFSLEIDQVFIPLTSGSWWWTLLMELKTQTFTSRLSKPSGGNDAISYKLFPGTLKGVIMQWFAGLPPKIIHTFNNLEAVFVSQFIANCAKRLEGANLFDIWQAKGESLKKYLAGFNNATIQVNDPDQIFFVKAFQKGLRVEQFSDSLALRCPSNMSKIRARVEKHIEVEED
ncbi:hypothetical protein CR513_38962, partial [Mucuna pruriens]